MSDGGPQESGIERIYAEPVRHYDAASRLPVAEADVRLVIVVGEDEVAAGEVAHAVAAQLIVGRRGDFAGWPEVEGLVGGASGDDRHERQCDCDDAGRAAAGHVRYLA